MSEFPSLAEILARHADWVSDGARLCSCFWTDQSENASSSRRLWSEHVEATWREACTISTVEQLHALPDRAVMAMRKGQVFYVYAVTGNDLPALLIWHPDWSVS
jgi:hypothetical protein